MVEDMTLNEAKEVKREVCLGTFPTTDKAKLFSAAWTLALNEESTAPLIGWLAKLEKIEGADELFRNGCRMEGHTRFGRPPQPTEPKTAPKEASDYGSYR